MGLGLLVGDPGAAQLPPQDGGAAVVLHLGRRLVAEHPRARALAPDVRQVLVLVHAEDQGREVGQVGRARARPRPQPHRQRPRRRGANRGRSHGRPKDHTRGRQQRGAPNTQHGTRNTTGHHESLLLCGSKSRWLPTRAPAPWRERLQTEIGWTPGRLQTQFEGFEAMSADVSLRSHEPPISRRLVAIAYLLGLVLS